MKNNFDFSFNKTTNKFELKIEDKPFELEIINLQSSNLLADLDDAYIFKLSDELNFAIYQEDNSILINLSQINFKVITLSLKFTNIYDISHNANLAIIHVDSETHFKIQCIDCKFTKLLDNTLSIIFDSSASRVEFFRDKNFTIQTALEEDPIASILADTEFFALPESRGVEFSLGIFDKKDESGVFSGGRPIRLGVPVISMVPVFREDLTLEELSYYNEGSGPQSRTFYFRAVANKELSEQSVKLLIYLPNGEDTITEPDFINLTKISQSGQNSVYEGEYIFYTQDYVYSVDGFVYFNIYTDEVFQTSIAFEIDESPTTYLSFQAGTDEINNY